MEELVGIVAIVMVFGMPIAITWISLRHKERMAINRNPDVGEAEIEGLSRIADILDRRVNVLESILDDEVPDWRENLERRSPSDVLR